MSRRYPRPHRYTITLTDAGNAQFRALIAKKGSDPSHIVELAIDRLGKQEKVLRPEPPEQEP